MRRRRMPLPLVVVAFVLAGCALDEDPLAGRADAPPDETATDAAPERTERACAPSLQRRIDGRIGEQLEAFAAGDTEGAWELASDAFRQSVGVDELDAIIEESFPAVADAEEHAVGHCRRTGDRVNVIVAVTSRAGDEQFLDYSLVRERSGWYVDEAVPLDPAPDDPGIITHAGSAPAAG